MSKRSRRSRRRSAQAASPAPALASAQYDAVASLKKRQSVTSAVKIEDEVLTATDRRVAKNAIQNNIRNFSLIHWAVGKAVDFNTSFSFQAATGDDDLDAALETLIESRSHARHFDATTRLNRDQWLRVAYACMLADGDVFALKLQSGALQGLEGDRIATPYSGLPGDLARSDFVQGVRYTEYGKPISYAVCKRQSGSLAFERQVRAENMIPMFEPWRFDQGRGVSPLVAAVGMSQDIYEGMEAYALKAKLVAWAGMVVKRGVGAVNPFNPTRATGAADTSQKEYNINKNGRPFVLSMQPGDELDIVESGTPPAEHIAHVQMLTRYILIALDIPYTFFDQTRGSYTIQKDAWTQWELSSRRRREVVKTFLNRWTVWQLSLALARRELDLPAGQTLASLRWNWQHTGRPWMDPKELAIDIEAIRMNLVSAEEVIKRHSGAPDDVTAGNQRHYQRMKAAGLPTQAWDDAKPRPVLTEEEAVIHE